MVSLGRRTMDKAKRPQKKEIKNIQRGDVWLVSFDPTVGHEIKKTRPALVVQNNIGNHYSPLTIVAAISSKVSPVQYPVEVTFEPTKSNGLKARSSVRLDQIRTVDKQRLIQYMGTIDAPTMTRVNGAVKISLGLIEF
jgi:mRNA interferase MazF